MELSRDLAREVQQSWHRFLQRTEALRPDLHRYCRALTGSVWDAEDLVQDTLLRAFAKLGEVADSVENPKGYLFRIASNLWTDHFRRAQLAPPETPIQGENPERRADVRLAAKQLMNLLPPQERAAVVLKDVFDYRLEEIASTLQTTVGAVKAALHRGRGKLATPQASRQLAPPSEALLDQFVDAFNARDLNRVASLLREDAVGDVVGMGTAQGRNTIRDSSLYYGLFLEKGEPRAEVRLYEGEPIVVIWYALDPSRPLVCDLMRFEELEGQISRLRFFCFCPETMAEIVAALGLPFGRLGYGVWAPEFQALQKQEEFQAWINGR